MICSNCGKVIANDSIYCEFCGAKIEVNKPTNRKKLWIILSAIGGILLILIILLAVLLSGNNASPTYNDDYYFDSSEGQEANEVAPEYEDWYNDFIAAYDEYVLHDNEASDTYNYETYDNDYSVEAPSTEDYYSNANNNSNTNFNYNSNSSSVSINYNSNSSSGSYNCNSVVIDDNSICYDPQVMPQFPGGEQAMFRFLAENVKYPVAAQENHSEGKVYVQFVVEKDGSLTDVNVVSSPGDPSLDKEAMRVVKAMPNWIPGQVNGYNVRVRFTIPVNFKLQ